MGSGMGMGSGNPPSEYAEVQEDLIPCSICGRKFRESIIARHEKTCRKNASKKVRVKSGTALRVKAIAEANAGSGENTRELMRNIKRSAKAKVVKKPAKWKQQSNQLREAMR